MPNYLHVANGTLSSGAFWSFGLRSQGSISEGAAQTAWHTAVSGFFSTAGVEALYSSGMHLTKTSTSTASSTWKQTTITRNTETAAGTSSAQELPDYASMLVTYRAATADKSSHGRWYLPAPVAGSLSIGTGGHLSSTTITVMAGALATMRNAITSAGLTPVILTRKPTKSGLPAYNTRAVTEWELVSTLAVQTRRGDKLIPARTIF
jgi:hypothetical protein